MIGAGKRGFWRVVGSVGSESRGTVPQNTVGDNAFSPRSRQQSVWTEHRYLTWALLGSWPARPVKNRRYITNSEHDIPRAATIREKEFAGCVTHWKGASKTQSGARCMFTQDGTSPRKDKGAMTCHSHDPSWFLQPPLSPSLLTFEASLQCGTYIGGIGPLLLNMS